MSEIKLNPNEVLVLHNVYIEMLLDGGDFGSNDPKQIMSSAQLEKNPSDLTEAQVKGYLSSLNGKHMFLTCSDGYSLFYPSETGVNWIREHHSDWFPADMFNCGGEYL